MSRFGLLRLLATSACALIAACGGSSSSPPPVGSAPWTRQVGTPASDDASAVAFNGAGDVYVAAATNGSFDGHANLGAYDALLVKYSSAGVKLWSRQFGTSAIDATTSVATDSAGNVYVGGATNGNLDGNPGNTETDGFIAKYDSSGTLLWVRQIHTPQADYLRSMAIDAAGNVIAVGYTGGSLDGVNAGGNDLFVVKYDSAGTRLWARQFGTSSVDNAGGVEVDAAGNIFVAGYTGGNLDGNVNAGELDAVLIKYNSAGVKQWTRQFGTAGTDLSSAIAIDSAANLYLAVRTTGVLAGAANVGDVDAVVMKFDSAGALQWARQTGSTADDLVLGIDVDAAGDVVAGGYTLGAYDGNVSAGLADIFLVKYDASGARLWSRQTGSSANDFAYGVRTDAAGNIYAAGYTEGAFDGASAGGNDIVVVRYLADGTRR